MNSKLTSVLIICTRNRPNDLAECLDSVVNLSQLPTEIMVVDSSDSDETERLCSRYAENSVIKNINYARSEKGLTIQRNFGLKLVELKYDIVHFIDDDVLLDPDYLANLNMAFLLNPDLVGASGMVLGGNRRPPRLTARLTLRDSNIPGKVLTSGYNVGAHETKTTCLVDWLPGCSMSYRTLAIQGLMFDEKRLGYALGEDVDFSMKAARNGPLQHIPEAKLFHKLSPINRLNEVKLAEMGVLHRWQLAMDHPCKVKKAAVAYASISTALTVFLKSVVSRRPLGVSRAYAEIKTLIRCSLGIQSE